MVITNVESDLFIFPEMFLCGYVSTVKQMRLDYLGGVFTDKMKDLSTKKGSAIICGSPVQENEKVYNAALFINGNDIKTYRKMFLDSETFEKDIYTPGNAPLCVEYKGITIGLAISHDLFSPELFRYYGKNADVVVCISAVAEKRMNELDKMISARALENGMNIILVNMVGPDPGEMMIGRSRWVGPDGNMIEGCTESSDVRTLRIDEKELKKGNKARLKEIRKDVTW